MMANSKQTSLEMTKSKYNEKQKNPKWKKLLYWDREWKRGGFKTKCSKYHPSLLKKTQSKSSDSLPV